MGGLTRDEAAIRYPASSTLMTDPAAYIPPPNGEALRDMLLRVASFFDDLTRKPYASVLIITHGYVLRVFHAYTLDQSVASIAKAPIYPNCTLLQYTYENGAWAMHPERT